MGTAQRCEVPHGLIHGPSSPVLPQQRQEDTAGELWNLLLLGFSSTTTVILWNLNGMFFSLASTVSFFFFFNVLSINPLKSMDTPCPVSAASHTPRWWRFTEAEIHFPAALWGFAGPQQGMDFISTPKKTLVRSLQVILHLSFHKLLQLTPRKGGNSQW